MTTDNDVVSIFEKHTVTEVQELLNETRNEIEKKKEELRLTVGERYRDLIEAADTIAAMKESASAIANNIQNMETLCGSLQQRGLIGFKTKAYGSSEAMRTSAVGQQYSIAVLVKILVDLPEILWGLTERKQYLSAAQLLLLGQHTHTVLQLSPNAAKVFACFPVITRQVSIISHFYGIILRGSTSVILGETTSFEDLLDAVCATSLLVDCSHHSSLLRFLDTRKTSLENTLASDPASTAKNQIVSFVKFFLSTLAAVNKLFIGQDGAPSATEQRIRAALGKNCTTSCPESESSLVGPLSFLQLSSWNMVYLQKTVAEFRPRHSSSVDTMTQDQLKVELKRWLSVVVPEAKKTIQGLLEYTTTFKALSSIRSAVFVVQKQEEEETGWVEFAELFGTEIDCDPWKSVIWKQVQERAEAMIKKEMASCALELLEKTKQLIADICSNTRVHLEEGNITDFVWSESPGDLPNQPGWIPTHARVADKVGALYYKSRGFTGRIQKICQSLEEKVAYFLRDLVFYAPASMKESLLLFAGFQAQVSTKADVAYPDEEADFIRLLDILEKTACKEFADCVQTLCQLAITHVESGESNHDDSWAELRWTSDSKKIRLPQTTTCLMTVNRVLLALGSICPRLKCTITASVISRGEDARRLWLGIKVDSPSWEKFESDLLAASVTLVCQFASQLITQFRNQMQDELLLKLSEDEPHNLLQVFSAWEMVTIEEEGEEGNTVQSIVHIPCQPSPVLMQAIIKVALSLNCLCLHTINRTSQNEIVSVLSNEVLSCYGTLENQIESKAVGQKVALQLSFDLRFIQAVFLSRNNKEQCTQVISLLEKVESLIDPFDLVVFLPHMTQRVWLAAQRIQILFGPLLSKDRQMVSSKLAPAASTTSPPNIIMPLVPVLDIPHFSNVPIPLSTALASSALSSSAFMSSLFSQETKLDSAAKMSQSLMVAKAESSSSGSKSASSLLSAMSSSWFGGTF